MTRKEAAIKAIELYDALEEMFLEPVDVSSAVSSWEYGQNIRHFGDIHTAIMRKRFDLERLKLGIPQEVPPGGQDALPS